MSFRFHKTIRSVIKSKDYHKFQTQKGINGKSSNYQLNQTTKSSVKQ